MRLSKLRLPSRRDVVLIFRFPSTAIFVSVDVSFLSLAQLRTGINAVTLPALSLVDVAAALAVLAVAAAVNAKPPAIITAVVIIIAITANPAAAVAAALAGQVKAAAVAAVFHAHNLAAAVAAAPLRFAQPLVLPTRSTTTVTIKSDQFNLMSTEAGTSSALAALVAPSLRLMTLSLLDHPSFVLPIWIAQVMPSPFTTMVT